jgi:hypothetical protein
MITELQFSRNGASYLASPDLILHAYRTEECRGGLLVNILFHNYKTRLQKGKFSISKNCEITTYSMRMVRKSLCYPRYVVSLHSAVSHHSPSLS